MGRPFIPVGDRKVLCDLCKFNKGNFCKVYGYQPRYFRGCKSFQKIQFDLSEMPIQQIDEF